MENITKREYFAGQVLEAMISTWNFPHPGIYKTNQFTKCAVHFADSLIEELEKTAQKQEKKQEKKIVTNE